MRSEGASRRQFRRRLEKRLTPCPSVCSVRRRSCCFTTRLDWTSLLLSRNSSRGGLDVRPRAYRSLAENVIGAYGRDASGVRVSSLTLCYRSFVD